MHADAVPHQLREGLPESAGDPEVTDQLADLLAFGGGQDFPTQQGLCLLECLLLCEMHDVHRRIALLEDARDRVVDRIQRPAVVQRYRPRRVIDHTDVPVRALLQIVDEE